ncbi:MAG: universal stress protein [Pegethrix bostrychoides GSE-TBD4-15B]|uniref:Universal stress protein n=1 Tax=Pegethrix bostrychoides GSE-TBD4-15B TaxID=2839662 RepID=A0A951PA89_9CYAN|nr:universal stress protein [Pegethrix bostrychoides GSE-TBD4-15B]
MQNKYTRILVAIDGSEMSEQVLEHAISLAPAAETRLMLVHVSPQVEQSCEDALNSARSLSQHHVDVMRSYWNKVKAAGSVADFRIPCGHPGAEICELALRWGAELILMGHRSSCPDVEFDSMSRYVLDHAPCPLLILPQSIHSSAIQSNPIQSNPIQSNQFASLR